jgi:chromatin segregation and condensation protein Rec8/ScpA/Scc1 (kleisin family)
MCEIKSKYLLNIDEFLARHPNLNEDAKELLKQDMESEDFGMFSFIVTYIFM